MKTTGILYLLIAICLAACTGHNRFDERMAAADSILISRPDSAYRMLCAMEALADSQTLARQMRYQLLRANAQNGKQQHYCRYMYSHTPSVQIHFTSNLPVSL